MSDDFDEFQPLAEKYKLRGERIAELERELADALAVSREYRRIAAHVPALVWIKAKEAAGFGAAIKANPAIDAARGATTATVNTATVEDALAEALRGIQKLANEWMYTNPSRLGARDTLILIGESTRKALVAYDARKEPVKS